MITDCIQKILTKRSTPQSNVVKEEVKMLRLIIPFLGRSSLELKKHLENVFKRNLPSGYKLCVIFKSQTKVHQFFSFKDKLPKLMLSHIVYKYTCDCCKAFYYGITERHANFRWCEHMGISPLTGRKIVGIKTDIRDHCGDCKNNITLDDFQIVARDDNTFNLRIKESIMINKDKPPMNKQHYSTPLHLFN